MLVILSQLIDNSPKTERNDLSLDMGIWLAIFTNDLMIIRPKLGQKWGESVSLAEDKAKNGGTADWGLLIKWAAADLLIDSKQYERIFLLLRKSDLKSP